MNTLLRFLLITILIVGGGITLFGLSSLLSNEVDIISLIFGLLLLIGSSFVLSKTDILGE